MFVFHGLKEAFQSLYMHKTRLFSIGFGVLWSIFILVLLLALGNSLHGGVAHAFQQYGDQTIIISSKPDHQGIPFGIVEHLDHKFKGIKTISPIIMINNQKVSYQEKGDNIRFLSVDACYAALANMGLKEGRFFSRRDEEKVEKFCVLGAQIKEKLFGKQGALGKYIDVGTLKMCVIGVLDDLGNNMYGEQNCVLVTNSFSKVVFQRFHAIEVRLTLWPTVNNKCLEQQLRSYFLRHLNMDSGDQRAKYGFTLFNLAEHAHKFHLFFKNLSITSWLIGVFFLLTSAVGITNMMLVVVRERKHEFSIRRILGARSREIVAMMVWEVIIVTFLAALMGLLGGCALLQLFNQCVLPFLKKYYLLPLTCSFDFILKASELILLFSCLAAIFPSLKALKIKPVEGLNDV